MESVSQKGKWLEKNHSLERCESLVRRSNILKGVGIGPNSRKELWLTKGRPTAWKANWKELIAWKRATALMLNGSKQMKKTLKRTLKGGNYLKSRVKGNITGGTLVPSLATLLHIR